MFRVLSAYLLTLALVSCGSDASEPPSTAPTVEEPPPSVAEASPPAEASLPVSRMRDWLLRLREARAASHAGRHGEAYSIFTTLVQELPGRERLRCEMGYVALRAGQIDDAEREVARALDRWATPPRRRDRGAYAMCLYNRGLVAEERDDAALAARVWRRSLAIRPNPTVRARLEALLSTAAVADEAPAEDEQPTEDEPMTRDTMIARLVADLGGEGSPWTDDVASPRSAWTAAHVRLTLAPDDSSEDCTEEHIVMSGPGAARVLEGPEVSVCEIVSYLADHVRLEALQFVAGPDALGELLAVRTVSSGRGDGPGDGAWLEEYEEATLHLCAERLDWACVEVALSSTRAADCLGSGGCDDPEDASDEPEDPTDVLPAPYVRGYALAWTLDGDALVLSDSSAGLTEREPAPQTGRVPLVALFEP